MRDSSIGGSSNFQDITTTAGPSNIVIGFSLTAATIPVQTTLGVLCQLTAANSADFGAPACLDQVVVSDVTASAIFTSFAQCVVSSAPSPPPPPPTAITLAISDIGADLSVNVVYTSTVDFSGFQMDVGVGSQPASVASATTPIPNFSVTSSSGSPTVVAFSISNAVIPSTLSSSVLFSATLNGNAAPGASACLANVVVSSSFQQGGAQQ